MPTPEMLKDVSRPVPASPPATQIASQQPRSSMSDPKDHSLVKKPEVLRQRIWDHVSASPLHSLWDLQGVAPMVIVKRTFNSFNEDNLLSRAAELGYYFLFALFPTLVSASSILGLAARSASEIYYKLLNYLSIVVPHAALGIVLDTFNQTTAHASGGKITFGLAAAVWSASVGFTAIQDTLNTVYKVRETRPYWKVRGAAMLVTILLSLIVTATLATLFGADFSARYMEAHMSRPSFGLAIGWLTRGLSWIVAAGLLILLFAVIYYFAPDVKNKRWHWLTPGGALGIGGWLIASIVLRIYLHYFDNYSVTYGSLGAVIILLTWFYITGLMLLLGAEINSEIAASVAEKKLTGTTPSPEGPIAPAGVNPAIVA
ncbi:YihY/virulence factor BrkB family protein [Granulicella sibirica]|uniref:Ribonuclease BN n=1 Tax=Granulicella sibirica TaxID=2479048 RepID=A0A4Q0SX23_9BACT|nr:YihY/virulence factor BrkB family protein [Granulicella sibirica]RXH54510.1 Ribonuclease BN [Granulicella sibirica]